MKKPRNIISRAALAVATAGALSFASTVSAQNETKSTSSQADPSASASSSSSSATATATPLPPIGSMAGVGQKPRKNKDGDKPAMSPAASSAASSSADKQFLTTAAKSNLKEIHMGEMAQKSGMSETVKKLGSEIAADHTKANKELMALTEKNAMKLDNRYSMPKMSKKEMENFDQVWLTDMMRDHERAIAIYEQEIKMGTDADAKAYAKKTLPTLKKHLTMVTDAEKKMAKKS